MKLREVTEEEEDHILKEKVIEVIPKNKGGSKNEIMKIGHGKISFTFVPQVVWNEELGLLIMDCPGFLDNRGAEINISNAVNVRNITSVAGNIKIVVCVSYFSLLTDR